MEVRVEEGCWGLIAEGAVKASAVVEGFEVIEDGSGGGGFGGERGAVVEEFALEGGEGAFSKGVVVAVACGAHALAQAVAGEEGAGG